MFQNKGWHFPTFHSAVTGCKDFFLYPQGQPVPSRNETKIRVNDDTILPGGRARTYRGTESQFVIQGHWTVGLWAERNALSLGDPLGLQSLLSYWDTLKPDS